MFKLFLFALLSCVVPFGDVGTDGITVYDLYRNGQTLWAAATFYFMWNPFVLHLLRFNRHILVHVPNWRVLHSIFSVFRFIFNLTKVMWKQLRQKLSRGWQGFKNKVIFLL